MHTDKAKRGKFSRNMAYHIDDTNKLEVKHDCNRSRLVINRVRVFVVVFKQVFIESRLVRFHCGFCKAKKGKTESTSIESGVLEPITHTFCSDMSETLV